MTACESAEHSSPFARGRAVGGSDGAGPIDRQAAQVVEPTRGFRLVGIVCALGAVVVALLGRPPAPTLPAAIALALQAAFCLFLYATTRRHPERGPSAARMTALAVLGLATALPGYFFGPNSGFAAVVALALVLTGMMSGRADHRRAHVAGWITYAALAGGQGLVLALVLAQALPDHSLYRVILIGQPLWPRAAAHVALQVIFLAAFLAGRVLQRRYLQLTGELEATLRSASLREALLDEARAHYRRALALGREGMFSGQTVGAYRLGNLIDRGGTCEVYEAAGVVDGSRAAVKLLRGDRLDDAQVVARFVEETAVAQRVRSPQLARVFAAGGLEERLPYIAMEQLEGEHLADQIADRGRLDVQAARRLVVDLSHALEAIHGAGLVHLDVSPRNVVCTRGRGASATWKLIDFGGARWADALADETRPVGTPLYVAPERLLGQRADARADLYGLTACLYLALTGRAPFAEDPVGAGLRGRPLAPREIGHLPPDVELVLAIGLAQAPDQRFASAAELRNACMAALGGALDEELRARGRAILSAAPWNPANPPPPDEPDPSTATLMPPQTAPRAELPGDSARAAGSGALSAPTSGVSSAEVARVWQAALRSKMLGLHASIIPLCIVGALLMGAIARNAKPLWFAWACTGGILIIMCVDRWQTRRWLAVQSTPLFELIVSVLCVGPAYALGLHSAFGAVLAITLFAFGAFRDTRDVPLIGRRSLILWGVFTSQGVLFGLILAGIVPDSGNVPVLHMNAGLLGPVAVHMLMQVIYVGAFAAGHMVDHRYQALMAQLEAAAREAAHKETLLVTARLEIDRALAAESEGLFAGQQIDRYRAVRLIGRGGMGEVYEAVEEASGRRVALKLIRRDRVEDPRSLRWFANEANTVGRVRSPFVAEVLEVGGLDGELPFIAMEYIDGPSLAAILRDQGRLRPPELRRLIADVARGLRDVHTAGILHRDLKPQNIMLTRVDGAPRWKLVDFGLAKTMRSATTDDVVAGTLPYMAPEQARGGQLDARSDLYSLCLVVYRALTGRPAFTDGDYARILSGRRRHSPPDPRRYTDLSPELEFALRIGLALEPDDRFASAAELQQAFEAALDEQLPERWHERAIKLLVQDPWTEPFVKLSQYSSASH